MSKNSSSSYAKTRRLEAAATMAAVTAIPNPVSQNEFLVFYNDPYQQLGAIQVSNDVLGDPPSALQEGGAVEALEGVPAGGIANPSSLACVLFQNAVNTYGVLNGTTKGELLLCRLSPGFQVLSNANPPLSNSSSITACSDSRSDGNLFYLVTDLNQITQVMSLTLPGTKQSALQLNINLQLNPTTYLGSAYGNLGIASASPYVAVQAASRSIYLFSIATASSIPANQSKGLYNTPIACVFAGNALVMYFFGAVGSGPQPDTSPVWRFVATDMTGFRAISLDSAPAPSGYTQLAAFNKPGPANDGAGTVVLTYVQYTSGELVSWEDTLEGMDDGEKL